MEMKLQTSVSLQYLDKQVVVIRRANGISITFQVCLVEKLSSNTSIVFLHMKEHFVVFLLKVTNVGLS